MVSSHEHQRSLIDRVMRRFATGLVRVPQTASQRGSLLARASGALLPSAHAIEREFRVQQALAGSAVPVAAMHALCEDESLIGAGFYVMDFVDGDILREQSLPGLEPAQRAERYDAMNAGIAALHLLEIEALE